MKYKLIDVASVIRSKNSGPYELTFDVIFKDFDMYNKVKAAKAIDEKAFCRLYNIPESDIIKLRIMKLSITNEYRILLYGYDIGSYYLVLFKEFLPTCFESFLHLIT